MANPKEIRDEPINTFQAGGTAELVVLQDNREYTITHLGINSSFTSDTNVIFLSTKHDIVPDGATGSNKFPLPAGLSIVLGPENGPISLQYRATGGGPLFGILAGNLNED